MTHTGGGSTGEPMVDAALAELSRLPGLPVDDHVAVFDAIHTGLRDSLADAGDAADGEPV